MNIIVVLIPLVVPFDHKIIWHCWTHHCKFHVYGRIFLEKLSDIEPFTIVSSFDDTKYVIQILSNNSYMKYVDIQSTPSGKQHT